MAENGTQGEWTLPDGWVWTTIGEVTQPIEKVKPRENPDAPFTYLDISSIDNRAFRIAEPKAYYGAEAPSRARQLVQANDVLFSTVRTYLKNIALVPAAYDGQIASTGFSVLRGEPVVSSKYLFYYTLTDRFVNELGKLQRGTSYPAVRDGDVRAQPIPLAPLPDQRRIVAEIETQFTRLDAAVAALERAQANLRRYKASVLKAACEGRLVRTEAELARAKGRDYEPAGQLLTRILAERRARWEAERPGKRYKEPTPPDMQRLPELPEGWVWVSLEQLSTHVTSGSRGWAKYYSESGSLFVRVGNFNRLDTMVDLENVAFVNAPSGPEADRTRLRVGDFLITITADVGMVGVVDERVLQWGEAFINQHVGLVRPASPSVTPYAAVALASEPLQSQFRDKQYGATKKGLNLDDLKSLAIPLPSLAEQHRIVAEVERRLSVVAALEASVEASLARARRLRQAVLKQAFEGRLVPQDPDDEPASVLLERIRAEKAQHEAEGKASRKKQRKTEKAQQLRIL